MSIEIIRAAELKMVADAAQAADENREAFLLRTAEWLNTAGADWWAHGGPHCPEGCEECDDDLLAPHLRRALAAASAYLIETCTVPDAIGLPSKPGAEAAWMIGWVAAIEWLTEYGGPEGLLLAEQMRTRLPEGDIHEILRGVQDAIGLSPQPCWCGSPRGPREPADADGNGCLADLFHANPDAGR